MQKCALSPIINGSLRQYKVLKTDSLSVMFLSVYKAVITLRMSFINGYCECRRIMSRFLNVRHVDVDRKLHFILKPLSRFHNQKATCKCSIFI